MASPCPRDLCEKIVAHLSWSIGKVPTAKSPSFATAWFIFFCGLQARFRTFANGEISVKLEQSVSNYDVFVAPCSEANPKKEQCQGKTSVKRSIVLRCFGINLTFLRDLYWKSDSPLTQRVQGTSPSSEASSQLHQHDSCIFLHTFCLRIECYTLSTIRMPLVHEAFRATNLMSINLFKKAKVCARDDFECEINFMLMQVLWRNAPW